MTARSAWLLGCAALAMAAMLLLGLSGAAWPRFDGAALFGQIAWVGLLGLGQQVLRRSGTADLAAGAAVVLVAGLILVLPPTMGLGTALAGALLVVASATISQIALARYCQQPAWLGLGALLLWLAATPDATGRLAAEALRRVAQEPAVGGMAWVLLVYAAALGLVALGRAPLPRLAAAGVAAGLWWALGVLAAGLGRTSPLDALTWSAQGLAVAGLAGAGVGQGLLAAVIVGCALYAATLIGSGRPELVVTALALALAARRWPDEPDTSAAPPQAS
ncbi:MAG: hypothetical protein HZB16_09280 [Armatimonadetes bacterium]|nr:hypothetical protein [Armatimonadota bacterium]